MEDAKNSGTVQSPRYCNGSQSKSYSLSNQQQQQQHQHQQQQQQQQQHLKDSSPRSASVVGQQPPFSRLHPLMAPQHTSTTTTSNSVGQSQSPHGAWASTPSDWDSAPNMSETMEATANGSAQDYHGVRSSGSDWDVKISPWDWEQMSTICAPGRGGGGGGGGGEGAHSSKGSYSLSQSSESGSIGGGGSGGVGAANRVTLPKIEADLGNGGGSLESNRIVNLVVDRRAPPQQSSAASIDDHRNRLLLGLGGVDDVSSEERRRYCQEHCNGGTAKIGAADAMIGLNLGRREYFEDAVAPARACGGAPTPFAVCPPGKKQRVQSPGVQVPRCQVDGCRQDLSSAKDYHRRHKVCEMHSKASRVMVAGLEQRFCQQCSRCTTNPQCRFIFSYLSALHAGSLAEFNCPHQRRLSYSSRTLNYIPPSHLASLQLLLPSLSPLRPSP